MSTKNLALTLGAQLKASSQYQFRIWAPNATTVDLQLFLAASQMQQLAMHRTEDHYFELTVSNIPLHTCYQFLVDDKIKNDPASKFLPLGENGPSEIIAIKSEFASPFWKGIPLQEYIIYELHVGTFTKGGTFKDLIQHVDELKALGITAIELMPITQSSTDKSWAYDVQYCYAVQNTYGGPLAFKEFVHVCHEKHIAVILDLVFNHQHLQTTLNEFGPYFTDKYQTKNGLALNLDAEYSHHVRRFFIENVLHWFINFEVDAIRIVHVNDIYDASAYSFLQELADHIQILRSQTKKNIYLLADNDQNNPRLLMSSTLNGIGIDAQWNDDFHHTLRALTMSHRDTYHHDYGNLASLAKIYKHGFSFTGEYSVLRKRPYGGDSEWIAAHQFINFSQNHFYTAHFSKGVRLSEQLQFSQLKLLSALTILSPHIPLLFMGEEYAEEAPFFYFDQHNTAFQNSILNHDLKQIEPHKTLLLFYQYLLYLRKTHVVFSHSSKTNLNVYAQESEKYLHLLRRHKDSEILMICQFNDKPLSIELNIPGASWQKILDAEDSHWLGQALKVPDEIDTHRKIHLQLPAFAFVIYERELNSINPA